MGSQGSQQPQVVVARTFDELAALRPVWETLPGGVVTTDIDAFVAITRRREGATPYTVMIERDGAHTIAVGRLEAFDLATKLGYKTVYAPKVRAITVAYGGVLGNASLDASQVLVEHLRHALAAGAADVVRFRGLRTGLPLHELVTTTPLFARRRHVGPPIVHWTRALPRTFDEFMASLSGRTREGVRRYSRKLEREHGERLALERYRGREALERFLADARAVAEKTYQHGLGAAITEGGSLEGLLELAGDRDWFRGWVLSIGGKPVAFWHGIAWRGVFSIGVPGYDPEYANLRVGTYVLMKAIADLCDEDGVETLDFGFGDAEYKRRFGSDRWDEDDVVVYAPTLRGIRVNLTRSAVLAAAAVARRVASRTSSIPSLKRRWRSRLSS